MVRGLTVFALVLLVLVASGAGAARQVPHLEALAERQRDMPTWGDWFVSVDEDLYDWDHQVYYTGFGGAVERVRQADVVMLGSSRTQFGLDAEQVRAFCQQQRLRFYSLAFGHGGSSVFPLELIRRHDLRPRVLVVGLDTSEDLQFFSGRTSPFAQKILDDGPWASLKRTYGVLWTRELQRAANPVLPYYLGRDVPVLYRSWSTGLWLRPSFAWQDPGPFDFRLTSDTRTAEERAAETARAEAFVAELRARGTEVFFAWIPANHSDPERARELARQAGVPVVVPSLARITSFDGSHLDRDTARRYSETLFAELGEQLAQLGIGPRPDLDPASCGPGEPPPSVPDLRVVRDAADRIWLLPGDGHRHLFPDWPTYLHYSGQPDPSRLPVVGEAELARTRWHSLVPSTLRSPSRDALPGEVVTPVTNGPVALPAGAVNLAEGRPARQSDGSNLAPRAVDGNTSGIGADQSVVTFGSQEAEHWWQVDLGARVPMSYIQLWPRTDECCLDRLDNVNVFVSDEEMSGTDPVVLRGRHDVSSYFVLGQAGRPTSIAVGRSGRYVRVQSVRPGHLDIAEVQVWSDPAGTR